MFRLSDIQVVPGRCPIVVVVDAASAARSVRTLAELLEWNYLTMCASQEATTSNNAFLDEGCCEGDVELRVRNRWLTFWIDSYLAAFTSEMCKESLDPYSNTS